MAGRSSVKSELARAKPRTKKGRFKRKVVRGDPKFCGVEACENLTLARGMCSKHYRRWQRWGDPTVVGKAGGPRYTPEALEAAGITTRQRTHWAASGLLGIRPDPKTGRYDWNPAAIQMALLIHRLSKVGFPLEACGRIARTAVLKGKGTIAIAPGIKVVVDMPDPEPPL